MSIFMTILVAVGGIGLLLAMPRARRGRPAAAGAIVLGGAGALLIGLLASAATAGVGVGWFIPLAIVALGGGIRVVTHPRPVYSALYFILVVVAVAGLLLLAQAEFLAVALVIIYAGAILVTYVFVIMLAQQSGEAPYDRQAREPFVAILAGFVLLGVIGSQLFGAPGEAEAIETVARTSAAEGDNVIFVGTSLLTHYAVGVELAGVLLLAAMVGAIAIARRKAMDLSEGEVY